VIVLPHEQRRAGQHGEAGRTAARGRTSRARSSLLVPRFAGDGHVEPQAVHDRVRALDHQARPATAQEGVSHVLDEVEECVRLAHRVVVEK
jgi:hypothetical protein